MKELEDVTTRMNRLREERYKQQPMLTIPAEVIGDLMEWVAGNRGSKHSNPYCIPEVKAMLKAIARARGLNENNFYDAAKGLGHNAT